MKCLVHINDFIVKENNDIYDFLERMFPTIKDLYYRLYFLQTFLSGATTNEEIKKINEDIKRKLEILEIPEYIVFIEKNGKYTEPIGGTTFNLVDKHLIKEIDDKEMIEKLMDSNNDNYYNFYRTIVPRFKEVITVNKKKIKK